MKASSVIHYHAVIHRALKYAVKIDLISVNSADKVERPKADKFIGSFYDSDEIQALFEAAKDTTKTKSSMRTLPLVPVFKEKLLKVKEQQAEYRRVCGKCYDNRYLEYICVDEMGTLISSHYLTAAFPKLLDKNELRRIRYHDLRHSCASLLLANGVPMKQIQEWLGHSDFSTTANVYAHLDYNSKLSSADAMAKGLSGALGVIS